MITGIRNFQVFQEDRAEMDLTLRVFGTVWAHDCLAPSCMVLEHAPAKFQTSSTSRKVHLKKNSLSEVILGAILGT